MAQDKLDPKLLKIVALAKDGIGGEKTAAIRLVKRICEREGISYFDVMNASDETEHILYCHWRNKQEEDILAQVCLHFAVTEKNPSLGYNAVRKVFIYTTTMAKHIETMNAAAVYLAAFRKERKKILNSLVGAFVYKHNLYRSVGTPNATGPQKAPDMQDIMRQARLASDMDDVTIRKAIGNGNA